MRQHVVPTLIASAVAATVGFGAAHFNKPRQEVRLVQPSGRMQLRAWPELSQEQVDKLTAALRPMTRQGSVVVYCGRPTCHDLAADLENAFESAHWPVDVQSPVMDETPVGLVVSDPLLARAIENATGINVVPMTGWQDRDKIAILIGRVP